MNTYDTTSLEFGRTHTIESPTEETIDVNHSSEADRIMPII